MLFDSMIGDRHISKRNGLYVVHKKINNIEYIFAEHMDLSDAIEEHDLLDALDWPVFSAKKSELIFDNETEFSGHKSTSQIDDGTFHDSHIDDIEEPHVKVSFKIGTSYKHSFLVLTRNETKDIIPHLPYEDECDVIFDGIKAKIKLNVLLRLSLTKGNEELRNKLEELSLINPNRRSNIAMLLNKEDENPISNTIKLKQELDAANKEIAELNNIIEKLVNINKKYEKLLNDKNILD